MRSVPRSGCTAFLALVAAVVACAAIMSATASIAAAQADSVSYREPYRPQFHFTPAKNWMNDPNGLVYYKGEYHLFYQYNPNGNTWGNMSWGHAVSTDLVHWKQLPLAIPHDDNEMVLLRQRRRRRDNTSGFGTKANPPMVAIYTSAYTSTGSQAQSLAYSTDGGRTWTKYAGNPVLDIGSSEFRDPKVYWYAPAQSWLIRSSLSDRAQGAVLHARRTSRTGRTSATSARPARPAASGSAPTCSRSPSTANPRNIKWVLVVNINPGGIAGGSGGQYFVGDFDGTTFTSDDDGTYTPPTGTVLQDFEGAGFGPWTTTGTAFGTAPAAGDAPGQGGVDGYLGDGLANSFHGGDASHRHPDLARVHRSTSDYLNFLVGGGNHPHVAGTVLDRPAARGHGLRRLRGRHLGHRLDRHRRLLRHRTGRPAPSATSRRSAATWAAAGQHLPERRRRPPAPSPRPTFTIDQELHQLPGRRRQPPLRRLDANPTAVEPPRRRQGRRAPPPGRTARHCNWASWDVSDLPGQKAQIQIVDDNTGGWGHINVDHIMFSDEPAQPALGETAVNLLVDGKVVRTATGANSETPGLGVLGPARPAPARQAQIQIVDSNTGGWGHILADQFTFADAPALSVVQRAHWLDYGKDFYAAVTFNNVPERQADHDRLDEQLGLRRRHPDRALAQRQSVPRELALRTIDGRIRSCPAAGAQLRSLRSRRPAYAPASPSGTPPGTTDAPRPTARRSTSRRRFALKRRRALRAEGAHRRTARRP